MIKCFRIEVSYNFVHGKVNSTDAPLILAGDLKVRGN
jgi:hypothetical protein